MTPENTFCVVDEYTDGYHVGVHSVHATEHEADAACQVENEITGWRRFYVKTFADVIAAVHSDAFRDGENSVGWT